MRDKKSNFVFAICFFFPGLKIRIFEEKKTKKWETKLYLPDTFRALIIQSPAFTETK